MKSSVKLLALILAVCMVMLAGCGSKTGDAATETDSEQAEENEQNPEESSAEEKETSSDEKETDSSEAENAATFVEENNIETSEDYPNSQVFTYNSGEESDGRIQKFYGTSAEIDGNIEGTEEDIASYGDTKEGTVSFKGYFGILLNEEMSTVYRQFNIGYAFYDMYTGECLLTDQDEAEVNKTISFNGKTYDITITPETDLEQSKVTVYYESIASNDLFGLCKVSRDYSISVPQDYNGLAIGVIPVTDAEVPSYDLKDHPDMILKVLAQHAESSEEGSSGNISNSGSNNHIDGLTFADTSDAEGVVSAYSYADEDYIPAVIIKSTDDPCFVIEYLEDQYGAIDVLTDSGDYLGYLDLEDMCFTTDHAEDCADDYASSWEEDEDIGPDCVFTGSVTDFEGGSFYYTAVKFDGWTEIMFYIEFNTVDSVYTLQAMEFNGSPDMTEAEILYAVEVIERNIAPAFTVN